MFPSRLLGLLLSGSCLSFTEVILLCQAGLAILGSRHTPLQGHCIESVRRRGRISDRNTNACTQSSANMDSSNNSNHGVMSKDGWEPFGAALTYSRSTKVGNPVASILKSDA